MGRRSNFPTTIDEKVRQSGMTCKDFAESALISPSTLLKGRAGDPARGGLHWTSLVLIGIRIGVFEYNVPIGPNDPRLEEIYRGIISSRGRGAPRFRTIFG